MVAVKERLYPALSLEMVRVANQERIVRLQLSHMGLAGMQMDSIGKIPTDAAGTMWLHLGQSDARRYISAKRLLHGSVDDEEIKGRFVLVGSSAESGRDRKSTPVHPAMPGVEIHAQALEQILSGRHVFRLRFALSSELVLAMLLGALMMMVFRSEPRRLPRAAIAFAASVSAILVGSWIAFIVLGVLLDPAFSVMTIALIFMGNLIAHILGWSE